MRARRPRLFTPAFASLTAASLAYFVSIGVTLPVLPRYVESALGKGDVAVGVAIGAFFVGALLVRPLAGRLGDRIGRRPLMIGGAALVGMTTLAYGLGGYGLLLVLRAVGGLGEAAFFVGAATMATDLAPEERRAEAINYFSVSVYGGTAFGPLIGETLLGDGRFGVVWAVAAAFGVGGATLALLTRETHHGGAADGPIVAREALGPGFVLFLGLFGLTALLAFVPLYVDEIGIDGARLVFLIYGVLVLVVRIVAARVPDALGPRRSATVSLVFVAAGMIGMATIASPAGLYGGTVALAVGMLFLYPGLLTLALAGIPATRRASVVGTFSAFFDLSQAVAAPTLGLIAAGGGYRAAFAAAAFAALGGMVLLRTRVTPGRSVASRL